VLNLRRVFGSPPILLALVGATGLVASAPVEAATLYALVDTGEIFASADGGTSWSVRAALPTSDAVGLIAASTASDLFLASGTGSVYRSQDAATTWSAVGAVTASDVVDMAGLANGSLLVVTGSGTLWVSTDHGATFSALASLGDPDVVSLARSISGDLFALTATGTVRRSSDGGTTWTAVGAIPVSDAVSLRTRDGICFALTGTGLTYRSQDQGATWIAVGTVSQVGMTALVAAGTELTAVSREGLVARTSDGASWTWVGTVNQLNVTALADDSPQTVGLPEQPGRTQPRLTLGPPRPNPLRSGAALELDLSLPESDRVTVELIDVEGRQVARRLPQDLPAGQELVLRWDPGVLSPGVYFLSVSGRQGRAGRSLVVTR